MRERGAGKPGFCWVNSGRPRVSQRESRADHRCKRTELSLWPPLAVNGERSCAEKQESELADGLPPAPYPRRRPPVPPNQKMNQLAGPEEGPPPIHPLLSNALKSPSSVPSPRPRRLPPAQDQRERTKETLLHDHAQGHPARSPHPRGEGVSRSCEPNGVFQHHLLET